MTLFPEYVSLIFVVILLLVGFYFAQKFLTDKEKELSDEKMGQIYKNAQALISEQKYKESIELLKSIDKDYSKYSDVETKIKEADQLLLNEYLTEADNYLKSEKYEKAMKVLDGIDEE
jgi:outer membrane protein assembly factor BamD (BamD/ComL family)